MSRRFFKPLSFLLAISILPNALCSDNSKSDGPSAKTEKRTPKQTVTEFYRHLNAGEFSKAKGLLFMPINNPMVASHIDDLLKLIAAQQKKSGKIHVFDDHIRGDLAVVVFGTEGSQYTDNIDTDPLFLRKKEGDWKLVLANSAKDLKEHELSTKKLKALADNLIEWYEEREKSVRVEWRNRKKHKK